MVRGSEVRKAGLSTRTWAARACWMLVFAVTAAAPAAGETIKVSGTGGSLGAIRILAEEFQKANPDFKVNVLPSLGSSGAIKALAGGAIDVAVPARALKGEEAAQGLVAVPYSKTPFVLAVQERWKKDPALTLAEAADYYAGRKKEWPDGRTVRIILRPKGDSDTQSLREMSPGMDKAVEEAFTHKGMTTAMTDQESGDMIEKLPGAIGSMTLSQIVSEKRAIRPVKLDGVEPTLEALKKGAYLYSKTFYIVTRSAPSASVKKFKDYVLSPKVRKVLERNGQMPLEPKDGR